MDTSEAVGPTVSEAVTDAVTAATHQTLADLPPLAATVDPDALATVLSTATSGYTRFDYAGCSIRLPHDPETVAVYATAATTDESTSQQMLDDDITAADAGATTRSAADMDSLVSRIVDAVTVETGAESMLDLSPLHNAVDTDALTALAETGAVTAVEFAYENCRVRINATGTVAALAAPAVEPAAADAVVDDATEYLE